MFSLEKKYIKYDDLLEGLIGLKVAFALCCSVLLKFQTKLFAAKQALVLDKEFWKKMYSTYIPFSPSALTFSEYIYFFLVTRKLSYKALKVLLFRKGKYQHHRERLVAFLLKLKHVMQTCTPRGFGTYSWARDICLISKWILNSAPGNRTWEHRKWQAYAATFHFPRRVAGRRNGAPMLSVVCTTEGTKGRRLQERRVE